MPYLEDYRHNDLAHSYFSLPKYPGLKIYKNYDRFATKAFYNTFKDTSDLENSRAFMLYSGSQTLTSISFWFLTLESFVATHIRICCIKFNLDFEDYKKLSLTQRLLSLIELLELDKKSFNEFDIIGKVHEFSQFRNELFAEKNNGEEIVLRKTGFSKLPIQSNQVDTFQAMLIVLEITSRLKYVFPGINSMPYITLSNSGVNVWEELDTCYENILKPCFLFALKKHELSTQLDMELSKFKNVESSMFKRGDVNSFAVAEQEEKYLSKPNLEITTNCLVTFNEFMESFNLHEKFFKTPKVVLE